MGDKDVHKIDEVKGRGRPVLSTGWTNGWKERQDIGKVTGVIKYTYETLV